MALSPQVKGRDSITEEKDEKCKEVANSSVSCSLSVAELCKYCLCQVQRRAVVNSCTLAVPLSIFQRCSWCTCLKSNFVFIFSFALTDFYFVPNTSVEVWALSFNPTTFSLLFFISQALLLKILPKVTGETSLQVSSPEGSSGWLSNSWSELCSGFLSHNRIKEGSMRDPGS